MSTPHPLTRRGLFGGLGAVLLGGVGISVAVHARNDNEPDGAPSRASDSPQRRDDRGVPGDPAGGDTGPHAVDSALDEGVDPGGLTAGMAARVDEAIRTAAAEGVELRVNSGWRSYEHQQRLFREAVQKYGSEERAKHWALPPDESRHVRGLAVDFGPPEAAAWLDENGYRFGLCRRYDNEPWHFEPTTEPGGSCPARQPHAGG